MNLSRFFLAFLLVAVGLAGAAAAGSGSLNEAQAKADTGPTPLPPVEIWTLGNGARLVVQQDPRAESVAIYTFFLVGRAEERGNAGINALLARAWGEASEYRSAALLQQDIAQVGGIGTEFSEDWVALYGLSGNSEGEIRAALQTLLVNLVARPSFTPEAVARAQSEQEQAVALQQDSLMGSVLEKVRERAYGASVYGISALGAGERFALLRPDMLTAHYNRYFRPERCVVSVVGNVDPELLRRLVEASFGASDWNEMPNAPPVVAPPVEAIPRGLKEAMVSRSGPATVVAAGWLAPGTAPAVGSKAYETFLLLNAVLGGGKASRLFSALRETTPIGYDLRTVLQPARTKSLWTVYVIGDFPVDTVRRAVLAEVEAIAQGARPITEEELRRARVWLKTRQKIERQRVRERAFGLGWAEIMGPGAAFEGEFDARMDAISVTDINALARQVLLTQPAVVRTQQTSPSAPSITRHQP